MESTLQHRNKKIIHVWTKHTNWYIQLNMHLLNNVSSLRYPKGFLMRIIKCFESKTKSDFSFSGTDFLLAQDTLTISNAFFYTHTHTHTRADILSFQVRDINQTY